VGDVVGIRGPFGIGWPMQEATNKNVVIVTGGLGCAPAVSVIHYVMRRFGEYKKLHIIQGLKHSNDLIWKTQYERWAETPDVTVRLAADVATETWKGYVGRVTGLIDEVAFDPDESMAMMCGPERMMTNSAQTLLEKGFSENSIYLSMERNMQCAVGQCGHCQLGPEFVCKDGPVFQYSRIANLLEYRGL
jgi:NAD(P)H-flavin reductase